MIKVSIDADIIIENCEFFTLKKENGYDNNWIYLFPNNEEFLKFWKYRKEIISHKFNLNLKENIRFNDRKEFEKIKEKNVSNFIDSHKMIFEFPDEETAFYFKLKYC